ncbi:MAG: hypothetical protein ACR2IH_11180 [Pyrinomonadaceae bacterium]
MIEKGKVRVIKKDEIAKAAPEPSEIKERSKRVAAREIVSNVTTWVNDLQVRKRDETKAAIEKFFGTPQPSET